MQLENRFVKAVMILRSLRQKSPLITFTHNSTAIILEVEVTKITLTTMVAEIGHDSVPKKYIIWTENDNDATLKALIPPWKQKIIVAIAMLVENNMI